MHLTWHYVCKWNTIKTNMSDCICYVKVPLMELILDTAIKCLSSTYWRCWCSMDRIVVQGRPQQGKRKKIIMLYSSFPTCVEWCFNYSFIWRSVSASWFNPNSPVTVPQGPKHTHRDVISSTSCGSITIRTVKLTHYLNTTKGIPNVLVLSFQEVIIQDVC